MCDVLVALGPATARGHTLFAKSSDRPPGEVQRWEHVPSRSESTTRTTYLTIDGAPRPTIPFTGSRPEWMWGLEHGVNDAGLAAGNATIYTALDPRPFPDALTGMDLVRLALERADTASGAVEVITELLERHGPGGSGHHGAHRPYWSSFLIADPHRAFALETSGREWAVEAVTRTRAISNRTTIPSFDAAHRHPRQPVEQLVDPRLRASRAVLEAEPVTVDGLQAHLASHAGGEDGWTICMHVDGVESTNAAMVAELSANAPPRLWIAQGSPCVTPFEEVTIGADRVRD